MAETGLGTVLMPLSRGEAAIIGAAIIDIDDWALLSPYSWRLLSGDRYAATNIKTDGKWRVVLMHRLLLNAPKGMEVDHRDGNGLNNQRSNLRIASRRENAVNVGPRRRNKTGYKGVHWDKERGLFRAQINWHGRCFKLGRFAVAEEAAHAYDAKAAEWHGEFAHLNFPTH